MPEKRPIDKITDFLKTIPVVGPVVAAAENAKKRVENPNAYDKYYNTYEDGAGPGPDAAKKRVGQ